MRHRSASVLMFVLSLSIFSGVAMAQVKDQRPVATIVDNGFISVIGEDGLEALFREEGLLEVLGGQGMISVIGEKGREEVIGEKGSEKIIGEKGSEKIIGEKASQKIIGEKGRLMRGVKTGRTLLFVGTDHTGASILPVLNAGNRLRVKSAVGNAFGGSTYMLVEPVMTNSCCAVVKVSSNGNVLAENGATGDSFYFNVPDPKIRGSLRIGQSVAIDRDGRWAFIRISSLHGLYGEQATYSFPIKRDGSKSPSTPAGGRRS